MAVINIDDAYILNETGAQVDKVTGLFTKDEETTEEEKAFAQLNIGASGGGGGGRNLLTNPFFQINQRSFTTGTNGAYFADRWKLSNTDLITATRNNDGTVTFTKTSGGTSTFIQHYIDRQTGLDEEATYTASLMDGDGNVYSVTEKFVPNTQSEKPVFINGIRVAIGLYGKGGQIWMGLYLQPASSGSFTLKAAKLELGEVSTLAQDAPPAYEQALNDCQYRCVVYESMPVNFLFCRGVATTTTNLRAVIDLPRSMAKDKVPTVTITGNLTTPQGNTITAMSSASTVVRGNKLVVNCTTSGLTGGNTYDISTGNGGQTITISADL